MYTGTKHPYKYSRGIWNSKVVQMSKEQTLIMKLPKQKRCNPLQQLKKNVVLISNESGGHPDLCSDSPTSPFATNKHDSDYDIYV